MGISIGEQQRQPVVARAVSIPWYRNRRVREWVGRVLAFAFLAFVAFLFVVPFVWMASTSLKPVQEVFKFNWIPSTFVWSNYKDALQSAPFDTYFKNSVIISVLATVGAVLSSSLVAYAFARLRWPGRDLWFLLVLGTMMLPGVVTLIPQYILFAKLGWVNTFRPLVVPAWLSTDAFYVFLLRQFFRSIPMELSEAAKIDGASELRIWWQIVMPLSRPALAAVTIFAFNGAWGDYLRPLIYLNSESKYTLQLGLTTFQQAAGGLPRWDWMMAASLVVMLPVVVVFFLGQKYFIEGITMTGIKR
ncbi:MAG TPA: carbohydrate ABC transporter permease [Thermomicrobiales bacterium]|jgi:ABC-type glycerol-3-phosphate transport system permease component